MLNKLTIRVRVKHVQHSGRSTIPALGTPVPTPCIYAVSILVTVHLQISRTCFVELKRSAGALVKYRHSNSTHGRFYDLSRVQMVNYLHLNQQGIAIEFHNSHTLTFYCTSRTYDGMTAITDIGVSIGRAWDAMPPIFELVAPPLHIHSAYNVPYTRG